MASLGVRDELQRQSTPQGNPLPSPEQTITFGNIRAFRGRNLIGRYPVLETWVTLGAFDRPAGTLPGFLDRIGTWVPSLQLAPETHLAEVLARVGSELQRLAGLPDDFVLWAPTPHDGIYSVGFGYQEEELARACLDEARALCLAAIADRPYDAAAVIDRLRGVAYEAWPGTRVVAIIEAAKARDIPVHWVNKSARPNLLQFGHGARQRRIMTGRTDRTPYLAAALSTDKELTKELLRSVGVPVAEGRRVSNVDDAWEAALELGLPVVVKPVDADYGKGVALNLNSREQVIGAFEEAQAISIEVMVERFAPGREHRLLVVGGRVVAAVRRDPPQVVGDGRSTIAQLVDRANQDPRRGEIEHNPLSPIDLSNSAALAVLDEQGYRPESIPETGVSVLIRRNSHRRSGGTTTDVTDQIHPEVAARMVDAARVIGLDVAGIDVMAHDIGRPLEEQAGVVLEVNFEPELLMHLRPTFGTPRPVGEALVGLVFPEGETGRIPIAAITGTNGKTTTTRLIAHLVQGAGRHVGMTCTDGIYVDGRRIETGDCSGPGSALQVLKNPAVEIAVLETARGGILREGLGFDRCDVAVVTNIGEGDHLGQRGIKTLEELARVKRIVVEAVDPQGTVVLNADEPLVAAMAEHAPAAITWFSVDADHPRIAAQRAGGGRSVFIRDETLMRAVGDVEEPLIPLAQVPMTHGGRAPFQVENALAAAGAAWALGLSREAICAGLATFAGDPAQTPGRFNVLTTGAVTVIVDYAHNASALIALGEATQRFPHRRSTIVYASSDRREDDVVRQGEILGDRFDRVVLYDNRAHSDRDYAELNALIRRGLAAGRKVETILEIEGELAAIDWALSHLEPGELLVIATEAVDQALQAAQSHPSLRAQPAVENGS
jgi:cyanophycin synthetase